MSDPRISVIMPAFNQEKYIADSIESVLKQSFVDWELVIIDDGSTDGTAGIVKRYRDSRIRYHYQPGRGVCEARNLGIQHSKGEYTAFLDADDLFHPDKLEAQVILLDSTPDVGLVYVSRFEIDKDGSPLNFVLQPETADLTSVVLGFPFAPSDLMVRRHWLQEAGGFDRSFVINEDREWYVRLVLAGCMCRGIRRFLSYRRLNDHKSFKNLPARMDDMLRALRPAFHSARLDKLDRVVQARAYHAIYQVWTYQAAVQGETKLAKEYFRQAAGFAVSTGIDVKEWDRFLLHASIRDGGDHEKRLQSIFSQLSNELTQFDLNKAVSRGYFMRGIRELVWGRTHRADEYLINVRQIDSYFDEELINNLVDMLMNHEEASGVQATDEMTKHIFFRCRRMLNSDNYKILAGAWLLNQAFKGFGAQNYTRVIRKAVSAMFHNPYLLFNRGLIAILVRSVFRGFQTIFAWNSDLRGKSLVVS